MALWYISGSHRPASEPGGLVIRLGRVFLGTLSGRLDRAPGGGAMSRIGYVNTRPGMTPGPVSLTIESSRNDGGEDGQLRPTKSY